MINSCEINVKTLGLDNYNAITIGFRSMHSLKFPTNIMLFSKHSPHVHMYVCMYVCMYGCKCKCINNHPGRDIQKYSSGQIYVPVMLS